MANNKKEENMNIVQTATSDNEVKSKMTTTIYINMAFTKLATDINSSALEHQFNGKGRKIALLPEALESTYLSYSSDEAGEDTILPPFEINNGDNIEFILQNDSTEEDKARYKWKGIVQNRYDLRLVSGKKSTYKAVAKETPETDSVFININFKLNGNKFSATWDPQVKIKK
jgi:hypothetical protein